MVTSEQQKKFIAAIAPIVQRIAPEYGLVCPSAIIGQACLESASGTSSKAKHHNYFGLKYRKGRVSCNSGTFVDGSKEERAGGKVVSITDQWYAFASMEDGVRGYCQFLDIANYANLKGISDPKTYLNIIRGDGYATSSAYVTNAMGVVNAHNLTQYDGKKEETKVNLSIIKNNNFRHHNTSVRNCKPEYIVVHYTASTGDASAQISYFNSSGATGASADFFVGWDGRIYQYNMDIKNRYSWAVGGGKQSSYGGSFYNKCLNRNQISIEMCCKSRTGKYVGANNSAWYFTDATVDATVQLVKMLMQTYGISSDHVIRHYDVNGKYCPGIIGWNKPSGTEAKWNDFKNRIKSESTAATSAAEEYKSEKQPAETSQKAQEVPYLVKVSISTLRIRKGPGTDFASTGYIKPGIYTIVEERSGNGSKAGWGRLKSGAGWISLDYTRRA